MPKYNVCVNATMNDEIFQNRHVCVGAGSDYPNYKASSSLAGTSFSQQIWGSIDGKRYLAVHPKTFVVLRLGGVFSPLFIFFFFFLSCSDVLSSSLRTLVSHPGCLVTAAAL